MAILVTGGAGFIGANFLNSWISCYDELVINLDKLTYAGNIENLQSINKNDNYLFIEGDICDPNLVSEILYEYHPRYLINFAAESHVDRSIYGPADFIETNIYGVFNLLESSKNFWSKLKKQDKDNFRFLHISTDEVYGSLEPNEKPFTELNRYQPNSPYSASKASADHLVRAYFHTYGLPVLTTNCSNNYGPYQFPEKLIPLVIYNALSGKDIPIYGDGSQIRDWLYVDDHCNAIIKVLEGGKVGEVFNVGGNNEKSNIEVVNLICKHLDQIIPKNDNKSYSSQIIYVEDRAGHDRRYAIDSSKLKKQLGWTPKESFDTGILKTVKWYLNNDLWLEKVGKNQNKLY